MLKNATAQLGLFSERMAILSSALIPNVENRPGDKAYLEQFDRQIWQSLDRNVSNSIRTAMDAIPYMDSLYKEKLRPYVEKYKEYLDGFDTNNPYGVPIGEGNWAGSGSVVSFGTTACFANLYFPEIIDKSYAYKAAAFMFGCHPYHNYSLVATVGAARPKQVFYGNNRADFSFIPGNVAPGLLFRKPDHFENFDDWPFLWGQNEGTIAGNCGYLIFGEAFKKLTRTSELQWVRLDRMLRLRLPTWFSWMTNPPR